MSKGFKSFKEGLDRKLLWEYWLAVKEHAWETFWGAGVPGIAFTIYTIYYAPARAYIPWAIAWAILVAGYYVWRADHVRLEKKIEATYVRKHTWGRQGRLGVQYYFGIINEGEAATIKGVRVQLQEMLPAIESISWLPIPLHQQHDNPVSDTSGYATTFDLHPSEPKHVDLLTGIDGEKYFHVSSIVAGVNPVVQITGRHRLKVIITGTDMPISIAWFAVWMDEDGTLCCELEPVTASIT